MGHTLMLVYLFDGMGTLDPARLADAKQRSDAALEDARRLHCAACRHPITRTSQRIAVQGAHEHTQVNPHGLVFRFGCFRRAEGCIAVGDATAEWTWFQGFRWQVALCAGCHTHMGWRFLGPDGECFHGLVLARLAP